jgi:hypothetical protein
MTDPGLSAQLSGSHHAEILPSVFECLQKPGRYHQAKCISLNSMTASCRLMTLQQTSGHHSNCRLSQNNADAVCATSTSLKHAAGDEEQLLLLPTQCACGWMEDDIYVYIYIYICIYIYIYRRLGGESNREIVSCCASCVLLHGVYHVGAQTQHRRLWCCLRARLCATTCHYIYAFS